MMNMSEMMKQAAALQAQLEETQRELAAATFMGSSSQGLVTATFSGAREMTGLTIRPELLAQNNPSLLQDYVVEAVNAALDEIDTTTKQKLGPLAGGLNLPFS
ncbi:MAG: YbaB/EbfC family nucleoid-associated protein [Streptococcaceae bacterium]|jgi:DNA-binding YbaB/EbfC family protein|nr:YbaB/EbfC family nucleoid-associated protein [Streptococcaceae bacterium]